MSQGIRVLQCFDCKIYQVDMVKKAKRWQCKICGAKQSLRTEYFRGTGAECRAKVQELNKQRELQTQDENDELLQFLSDKDFNWEEKDSVHAKSKKDAGSKWTSYVDPVDQSTVFREENDFTEESERGREHLFTSASTKKWPKTIESSNSGIKRKLAGGVGAEMTNKKVSKWGAFL